MERRGVGVVVAGELEDEFIERGGGHAGPNHRNQQIERPRGQLPRLAHAFEALGPMQLYVTVPPALHQVGIDECHEGSLVESGGRRAIRTKII